MGVNKCRGYKKYKEYNKYKEIEKSCKILIMKRKSQTP